MGGTSRAIRSPALGRRIPASPAATPSHGVFICVKVVTVGPFTVISIDSRSLVAAASLRHPRAAVCRGTGAWPLRAVEILDPLRDVGCECRRILGNEVAGALVAVDVGVRHPVDQVAGRGRRTPGSRGPHNSRTGTSASLSKPAAICQGRALG